MRQSNPVATDHADPEDIRSLRNPGNLILVQTALLYLLFAASVALVNMVAPRNLLVFLPVSIAAWAVIGWGQFALFNALHEGLHNRFGHPHRDWLVYLVAAYPVGFKPSYKQVHLDHHRYLGDPSRDPDYVNYAGFPRTRIAFVARLLLNLCGALAILQFLGFRQRTAERSGLEQTAQSSGREWGMLFAVQTLIFSVFATTVGPWYYVWLWLIPIATFGKFYSFLRTFCEHADPLGRTTVRTITGSFPGEKLLGVFCFHYHAEHHQYVFVPKNQLALAHRLAYNALYHGTEGSAQGIRLEHYEHGYWRLLLDWFHNCEHESPRR